MEEKQTEPMETTGSNSVAADESVDPAALEKAKKRGAITADLMTRPSFMAAHTSMSFIPDSMKAYGPANMVSMYEEVHAAVKKVVDGDMTGPEALLIAQAVSLNLIYNECASLAGMNIATRLPQAEVLMRMALKAQAQCTQTLRVLGELKNPRQGATFVKQQNNATTQQVNNGGVSNAPPPTSRTHEEKERSVATNELLTDEREAQHAATLDTGATRSAGGEDPQVEAVGAVDGSGQ
ncbi:MULTISPECIES: hypothetical protein [unclassified Burkholderia]|uniref:hypothetical protein n=1 Tax=unclassified Burkholderia TaxID=2613784 RepID=UPI000F5972B0|nr:MULTISPECIES: hypothetical protein [unclassified Burkholderia]RQS22455.1 hypothetical protein DIE05_30000 [Burkholderia sp. Bp8995]RQS39235.1 hypothetical protein DIE00_34085 [Burkholderia sp. Bp8989]